MPNWVFNENVFYSNNKENIKDFHKKLTEWASHPAMEYEGLVGFNAGKWLGNILISAGFPYNEVDLGQHGRCRGEITGISEADEMTLDGKTYSFFVVSTMTAWERMSKMWFEILKKHYGDNNDIGIAFTSDEESTEFFEVYNPDNILRLIGYTGKEKYAVNKYIDIPGSSGFDEIDERKQEILNCLPEDEEKLETEEETASMLSTILQKEIEPEELEDKLDDYIKKCNELFDETGLDCSINIIPITFVKTLNYEI